MEEGNKAGGFTLIELMIVVAIVAIIAAIAYPSYRSSVIKSDRSDAKVALTSAAQALERCYTQFDKYNDTANCAIAKQLTKSGGFPSPEGFYTLTGTFTADTYTLTAKPVAGKSQEDDTQCASLTLDNTGREGASGIDPRQCW